LLRLEIVRTATPIDLAAVGLLSNLLGSTDIKTSMSSERKGMSRRAADTAKKLCQNCPSGLKTATFEAPGYEYVNLYLDNTPCLGVVGSSILSVNTRCSVTADCKAKTFSFGCTSSWQMRDEFTNPASRGEQGNSGKPFDFPFSKRFDINADWAEFFAGGGNL